MHIYIYTNTHIPNVNNGCLTSRSGYLNRKSCQSCIQKPNLLSMIPYSWEVVIRILLDHPLQWKLGSLFRMARGFCCLFHSWLHFLIILLFKKTETRIHLQFILLPILGGMVSHKLGSHKLGIYDKKDSYYKAVKHGVFIIRNSRITKQS